MSIQRLWMFSTPGLTKQILLSEAEKLHINLNTQMVIMTEENWKELQRNCLARVADVNDDSKTILKFEPRPRSIIDDSAFLNYYSEEERNGL